MDRTDDDAAGAVRVQAPPTLTGRLRAALRAPAPTLEALADRFRFEATERESRAWPTGAGGTGRRPGAAARRAGARRAGRVSGRPPDVLHGAGGPRRRRRVPGPACWPRRGASRSARWTSYATLARRIGHPEAARAVGNALGANPVPVLVPCHRVIRGDGTWGHYAFGAALKTRLLALERATPLLVGCTSTRIVCRRGCRTSSASGRTGASCSRRSPTPPSVGYRPCQVCRPRDDAA